MSNTLGAERSARGWSQSHVAKRVGISRQSYAAIEAGQTVPSTAIALRLAVAFGKTVEELFSLGDRGAGQVAARWAGGNARLGARVRLARVRGKLVALGAGEGDRPMRGADGVVVARRNDSVEVSLLPDRPREPALVVLGCDPAFGMVAEAMRREWDVEVCWSQRASLTALESLARGEAHVVGAHLKDPASGEFNARWVHEIVPFPCTRIVFAWWEQAILVAESNPLGIGSIEDLVRPDVRFLNREAGSGSRMLLDEHLRAAGVAGERIPGYGTSARGHMAVAEAIASGLVDAGVGIHAAGSTYGLGTVPLGTEVYELIVPDHFLDIPAVQVLLNTLRRPGVRAQVEALGGYDASSMGEEA